jgi:hypothetical protein
MHQKRGVPRALFLSQQGMIFSDEYVCSGELPSRLGGQPCLFSDNGRIPSPCPLDEIKAKMQPKLGRIGDLAPPCAIEQLGGLEAWMGAHDVHCPDVMKPLRLFKCRQMFLLVVPGLKDSSPQEMGGNAG